MGYEEYMRSVLGYNQMPGSMDASMYDDYYYDMDYLDNRDTANTEMLDTMYPEIYRVVYPMVCKICIQNSQREVTKELVDSMTEEIYSNVEPEERQSPISTSSRPVLKNGDVRNPNAKEPETESKQGQEISCYKI